MTQMKQADIEALRETLEAEQETLEEALGAHGRARDESGEWEGSSAGPDGIRGVEESDPNDVADQIEELVTNVPLVEELEARHRDVTAALEKVNAGTYGTCESCGEAIPLDRLKANPAARACIADAR